MLGPSGRLRRWFRCGHRPGCGPPARRIIDVADVGGGVPTGDAIPPPQRARDTSESPRRGSAEGVRARRSPPVTAGRCAARSAFRCSSLCRSSGNSFCCWRGESAATATKQVLRPPGSGAAGPAPSPAGHRGPRPGPRRPAGSPRRVRRSTRQVMAVRPASSMTASAQAVGDRGVLGHGWPAAPCTHAGRGLISARVSVISVRGPGRAQIRSSTPTRGSSKVVAAAARMTRSSDHLSLVFGRRRRGPPDRLAAARRRRRGPR